MRVLFASLVMVLVAGVMGAPTNAPSEPNKCCFGMQYTATLGLIGGQVYPITGNTVFLDGQVQVARDFYRKKEGTITSLRQMDGSYKTTYTLTDFANGLIYTKEGNGTCFYTPMPTGQEMLAPCIPDYATYLGPSTFAYGDNSLHMNTWEFGVTNPDYMVRLAVTRDGCIPVAETANSKINGVSMQSTYFFTNYHPGIQDVNALTAPTNCQLVQSGTVNSGPVSR